MKYQVDPNTLIQMIKSGKNPQQLMLSILETQYSSSPLGQNLLMLAKNNQTQEIEQIARNLYQQQGKDFDKEFEEFKRRMGL